MKIYINHIAIYAKDMLKMLEFYKNILGFNVVEIKYHENNSIKMIRMSVNEEQSIELFNFDTFSTNKEGEFVNSGFMHIGFEYKDLKKEINNINKNVFIGDDKRKHFFIKDPENNLIEFSKGD